MSGSMLTWLSQPGLPVPPAYNPAHLFVAHLPRVLEGYQEVAPLAEGWEDRVGLHQLFPLLVHACLFGGRYGARAAEVARRYH